MSCPCRLVCLLILGAPLCPSGLRAVEPKIEPAARTTKFQVTIDRGADIGQDFGSLFEVTSADGSLTIGAGFLRW